MKRISLPLYVLISRVYVHSLSGAALRRRSRRRNGTA